MSFVVKCRAKKLSRKDVLGLSDPFLCVISRGITIMRTAPIMNSLSPNWESFTLHSRDIGSIDQFLTFEVWDWNKTGTHDFIGSMESNLTSLLRGLGQEIAIMDAKDPKGKKPKKGGYLIFQSIEQGPPLGVPGAFRMKFKAKDIPRMDKMGLGKSDPYLEIWGSPHGTGRTSDFSLVARTMYLKNTTNPTWEEIMVQAHVVGGIDAPMMIRITDWNSNGSSDFIGSVRCTLRELTFPNQKWPILNPALVGVMRKNSGFLTLVSTIVCPPDFSDASIEAFVIHAHGKSIERKDMMGLGKSDPYFKVFRHTDNVELYRSEIIKGKLNPAWEQFTISLQACGGLDAKIVVECWDWDKVTKDDFIGKFTTTLRALSLYVKDPDFCFINPTKVDHLTYRNSGFFVVKAMNAKLRLQPPHAYGTGRMGTVASGPYEAQPPPYHTAASQPALYPSSQPASAGALYPSSNPCSTNALYPSQSPTSSQGALYPSQSPISSQGALYPSQQPQGSHQYGSHMPPPTANVPQQNLYASTAQSGYQNSAPPNASAVPYASTNPYASNVNSYATNTAQSNPYANNAAAAPSSYASQVPNQYTTASAAPGTSNNANLPSYITGLKPAPKPSTNQDLYGSSTYSPTNLPSYLSGTGSQPANSQQKQAPATKPYGYY